MIKFVLVSTPPLKPTPVKKTTAVKKPAAPRKPAAKKRTKASTTPLKKPKESTAFYRYATIAALLLILFSPFYYKVVLYGFRASWHWVNDIGEDPDYRYYKSFNIHVSEKYTIHGIDVSYCQGKIDWPQVKAMDENGLHISFAFIKATEGDRFVDSYFQRNWREAAKTGLICGAYHYFRPGVNGKAQAKHFLKTVKPEQSDLPLVVDVEELDNVPPSQMRGVLTDFLSYVYSRTRIKPLIYSGLSFYTDYLKGSFDAYPVWIAHYNQSETRISKAANWKFWQYSTQASVDGIRHKVDFDTFNGDSVAFHDLLVH